MADAKRYIRKSEGFEEAGFSTASLEEKKTRIVDRVPKSEVTHIANSSGKWNDLDTWEGGSIPDDGAKVLIDSGVSVKLSSRLSSRIKFLRVEGTLEFDNSVDTRLRVDTAVALDGSRLEIGTESNPVQKGVDAEIEFIDNGAVSIDTDPYLVGRGLIVMGDLEMVGAQKTSWARLSRNPESGDTSFELAAEPTNWNAGDRLITPGLEPYADENLNHRDEERNVAGISGTTVQLDSSLSYDHVPPDSEFDTYVLNMDRNIRLFSENSSLMHRGHFMVMSPASKIKYVKMKEMGRTDKSRDPVSPIWYRGNPESSASSPPNQRARYSLHFHHTGPEEPPHRVIGCVVEDNPGWGYVNHDSHVEFEENISYRVYGSGFSAESGSEQGHFKRNFALRSEGSGENTESRKGWSNAFANDFTGKVDDFGHSGHGFWIHTPLVEVEDNIAAGHRHTPITYWCRALYEAPLEQDSNGNFVEALDGKHDTFPKIKYSWLNEKEKIYATTGDTAPIGGKWHDRGSDWVYGSSLPLRSFKNNVAFGCGGGFDLRGGLSFRNQQSKLHRSIHSGNKSFNTGKMWLNDGSNLGTSDFNSSGNVGLDHRYVGNQLGKNYTLVGTGDGYAVYNNNSYIDDFHIEGFKIKNWKAGVVPSYYTGDSRTNIKNTDFQNNQIDIRLKGKFGSGGRVVAKGNSYSGNIDLKWEEIFVANMIPTRFLSPTATSVRLEGRTVYHGWSRPDFVIVKAGDTERLEKMMNHGNESRWQSWLNGDDPRSVLPGTTHQELYDQYGLMFYGGIQDPAQTGFEQPSTLAGSGGKYDSTPFLGPKAEDLSQPSDEIWIDAVNTMNFSGDYQVISYGDGVTYEEPISLANDQSVVQLNRDPNVDGARKWDEPQPSGDNTGIATYTFEVDETGEYHVHPRCQTGRDSSGGSSVEKSRFFTRIDGGEWKLMDNGTRGGGLAPKDDLVWPIVGEQSNNAFTKHQISSTGSHTVEIAGKGAGMRLDKLLIKHEKNGANPAGKGKPHTPKS